MTTMDAVLYTIIIAVVIVGVVGFIIAVRSED
jgi:preprotein translocase subunit Sss1